MTALSGRRCTLMTVLLLVGSVALFGQQPPQPGALGQAPPNTPVQAAGTPPSAGATDQVRLNYVLRPGDQIMLRAFGIEEISERPYRIDDEGFVSIPLVNRLKAAGRSLREFESDLVNALKTYVLNPQVMVTVAQFRSEPVFFVGAFKTPGIYSLQGPRTLVEMMSTVGGLQPNASRRIHLTRRLESGKIPLPNATEDLEAKVTRVDINIGALRDNINPAEDIQLAPFDVVTVERAEMIFVSGELARVGGFEVGERDSLSVSQVVSMAGGLSKDADPENARVLRPVLNTSRRAAIPVNLNHILDGRENDFPLQPNDILYIPRDRRRAFWGRVLPVGLILAPALVTLGLR